MSGSFSRTKGANFERAIANIFKGIFGEDNVKRGLGQSRSGSEVPDVDCPYFWIECKRGAKCDPKGALRQADAASKDDLRVPLAVTKEDFQDPMVTMYLDDFCELLADWVAKGVFLNDRAKKIEEAGGQGGAQ
jgi:hypothetical protein